MEAEVAAQAPLGLIIVLVVMGIVAAFLPLFFMVATFEGEEERRKKIMSSSCGFIDE